MSDLDETDYYMSEESHTEGDDDEDVEKLYSEAKAKFKADALARRFEELFSLESAMQRKTTWGFRAAKRLLKNAVEQSNPDAITAHYRQLLSYENAVATYDIEKYVLRIANRFSSLSHTEVLRALFSASIAEVHITNASSRTAVKLAQPLVQLQPDENTLGSLADLQHRLERTNDVSTTTKNRCLLELYALEMELLWRTGKLRNMEVAYRKALSMEEVAIGSQHMPSAHGYYGRYLLRSERPTEAVVYLVKAVEGSEATSMADGHLTACVQTLALVAYTSADTSADELLHKYSGRADVTVIRRFAMAFLREDVDGLEQVVDENAGTFKDREIRRLLRHYETMLKRKLCLRTSPLPSDCWSDVLQCLTHPIWHDLQSMCRKFEPILAPLLHHLHSDMQKTRFMRVRLGTSWLWEITNYSTSGREDKVVRYDGFLGNAVLACAVMQDVVVVEINASNWVTTEGIVHFCFGRDGRRLEIRKPMITGDLLPRLVETHTSTANDHEFTLIVTCDVDIENVVPLQTATAYPQHLVEKTDSGASYAIPSGTALLTIKFALALDECDTITVIRKRLSSAQGSDSTDAVN